MMKQDGLMNTIQLNKRYRLIRILGQGGFGVTYIAEDETLGQKVVIKEYFPVGLVKRTESHEIVLKNTEIDKKQKIAVNRLLHISPSPFRFFLL